MIYKEEVYNIVGAAFEVHKELGNGFLEAVYQEALAREFRFRTIPYCKEKKLNIFYKEQKLDKFYIADFICYDEIIVELKALQGIDNNHVAQVLNYLKATNSKLGLIINFGTPSLQYKRIVNEKYYKK